MTIQQTPRPMLALFGALVALVAFLIAPDTKSMPVGIALYWVAAMGVGVLIRFLLTPLQRREDQRPFVRGEVVASIAEALVFVGAGYCANVEPGVIKLCGVLPLGWACAVVALILMHLEKLGLCRGIDGRSSRYHNADGRMIFLMSGTVMESVQRLWDWNAPAEGGLLNVVLSFTLFLMILDGLRFAQVLLRAIPQEKD